MITKPLYGRKYFQKDLILCCDINWSANQIHALLTYYRKK